MRKRKNIIISIIVAMILIIMIIVLRQIVFYNQEREEFENKEYNALKDFTTIKEVAAYLDCENLREEESTNKNFSKDIYLKFKYDLYTDGASNQDYFYSAALLFAQVCDYENIRLIDNSKEIVIAIVGDKKSKKIIKLYINGSENFYGENDTLEALEKYTKTNTSRMDIQSSIIKELIEKDWEAKKVDFGTKESTFDGYDIYFDEGIEVKKVGTKVFNIVFTEKYPQEIINGITVNTEFAEIENKIGTPGFGKTEYNLIGYKGNNIYIFFEKDRVSIYPVERIANEQQFLTLVDDFRNTSDLRKFISGITDLWPDYDKYEYDSNYIDLVYTLRGVKFEFNTQRDNGVIFYSNYNGSYISDLRQNKNNLPKHTYFEDKDLIYENEKNNLISVHNYNYIKGAYDFIKNESINATGENIQRYLYDSKKFFVDDRGYEEKLRIISINRDYPPFETEEITDNYFWIDDITIAYGVKNKGIYLYNAETREKVSLIEGTEDFNINNYQNGILYYDNKYLIYDLAKQEIYTYLAIDDSMIIYSIRNRGIYLYNIITQETNIVLEGTDEFKLEKYENGLLYYDNFNSIYVLF